MQAWWLFVKQNSVFPDIGAGRTLRDHATPTPHIVGGDPEVQKGDSEVKQPLELVTSIRAPASSSCALALMVVTAQSCVLGTGFIEPGRHRHPEINTAEERHNGQKERCTYQWLCPPRF